MAALGRYYRDGDQQSHRPLTLTQQQYWAAHLMLISALLYVLFEERFTVGVDTGGRGALQPVDFLIPLVGALVFLGMGKIPGPRLLRANPRGLFWAPYVILTVAFPVLGVFVRSEPVRTMYTSIHGAIELSFILFGAWAAFAGSSVWRLARGYAWFAVIFEFLFALIDYLNKTGMYPTALGQFLLQWNVESEATFGEYSFITWRCVGTYTNPNELGFWSIVAFWVSALLFRGMFRFTGLIAAVATLILSQSRGSLLTLLATCAIWLAYLALSRDPGLRGSRDATYLSAIGFVLTVGWLGGALSQSDGMTVSDKFSFIQRFERGLDVLAEGAGADANSKARVNAWQRALDFYYEHPLGTWVSPRLKFHLYIDSEYVKTLLQGSVLYLFALALLIACAFWRIGRPGIIPRVTAMLAVTAAMNGISAYPFSYPTMGIFWIVLGYDLTSERLHVRRYRESIEDAYELQTELVAEAG